MDRLERAKKFAVNVSDWWDTHKRMADFAASEVRAERARIAERLRKAYGPAYDDDNWVALKQLIEELEAK